MLKIFQPCGIQVQLVLPLLEDEVEVNKEIGCVCEGFCSLLHFDRLLKKELLSGPATHPYLLAW